MMKSILMKSKELRKYRTSKHTNTVINPTAFARQAIFLMLMMFMSVGSVWAQTTTIDRYIRWDQTSSQFSISDLASQLGTDLATLKTGYCIKWYILDGSSAKQVMSGGNYQQTNWSFFANNGFWPYQYTNNVSDSYCWADTNVNYWNGDDLETSWDKYNMGHPVIWAPSGHTFQDFPDYTVVCEASAETSPSTPAIQYIFHFNATGIEPDDFVGTFSGTETNLSHEVESRSTSTTTTIDMSGVLSTLPSAQYARFYLTQGGEAKNISTTAISVSGGQTTSKDSRGVYLYTGSTLTATDLSAVTVNLPAGTYSDYQLVAVFSDDAPRDVTGTTVAQEPADLDVKYVYSFNYPTTVIDKYIKWNQNSSDKFDITSLPTDLGMSLPDINSSYYIRWRINNGSSDINFATSVYYSTWRITSPTDWSVPTGYSPSGQGDIPITYIYTGKSDLTSTLGTVGKLKVTAPSSDLFSDYPNYTVICEVFTPQPTIDESGVVTDASVPTIRYIFHFSETGKKPDSFAGSLKTGGQALAGGAVVGQADVLTNTSQTSATLDFSGALAAVGGDVKYARFYLIQEGTAVDPTGKLAVTDGTAGPETVHGFYVTSTTGLTASDLEGKVTLTLPAGEFEDYQVGCVFSTDEATELPTKEPDWDLQYTYIFEYPFKGDVSSATKVEKTFTLSPSTWAADNKEFSIDFDFTNSIILLKNNDNSTLHTSVTLAESFWDSYPGAQLGASDNFYIRWFLKDKSTGVETYIPNSIRNITGASTYEDCAKAQYGRFWSTGISSVKDLATIMRIKIDGTPESPGTTFNITDYDLVCTISTVGGETYNGSNQVTMEPATMQMQYTFHFEDIPFPADNINTVKTIYKTALYDKATGKITPDLFTNYAEVLTELNTSIDDFGANGYMRWYVTTKAGDLVSDMADWSFTAGQTYTKNDTYGYYINKPNFYDYNKTQFNPTITLPGTYDKETAYKNYQVVCVVTNDQTGVELPNVEPSNMKVKYVFNLILTESEFANLPFVHYKGQSGRDWTKPEGSNGSMEQKIWDSSTGEPVDFTGDIRQGVHTWEYNLYILPGEERKLLLPFEKYEGDGNNLEPRGYIRWYDWKGDTKVVNGTDYTFTAVGTELKETDRGLFGLCLSGNPTHVNVGVTFTPTASFSETIDIACDVSKYSDGITTIGGTSYLIHEPTLSNRYIFHIHPASEMANSLAASKKTLTDAETIIKTGATDAEMHTKFVAQQNTMFNLLEDKGKMVVSLKDDMSGKFALRFDSHNLKNYTLNAGTTETPNYVSADKVQWYAYYETADGIYVKQIGSTVTNRITTFEYSDFTSNTYTNLKGEGSLTVSDGKKFHVVGYVGNGDFNVKNATGTYAPVVHYELHFMAAPAIPLKDLKTSALNRTDEYMTYHYQLAGLVDFDGNPETDSRVTETTKDEYYSTENWDDAPTSSANNMTWVPREWSDIEYGFSYPQLTATIKNGYGGTLWLSPEHGDYIMLKSMNVPGISSEMDTPPHYYHWWDSNLLYDYTHTYTDALKYGSFLYTDASDESRSIATIPFTGSLCSGSTLYFTAAVADMTGGSIKPQLVIRISSVDEHGNRTPLVAFHTCDISTTGAITGEWNQVYGQSTVPVSFDNSTTSYVAEVINYANDTNGADFAIDQIAIYISTAKVKAETTSTLCDDTNKVKVKITADAENLINTVGVGNKVNLYYRLFERNEDGNHLIREKEALIGEGVYSDETGAPKGYGVVADFKADLADLQTTATSLSAGQTSGFYLSEETGTVVFQLAEREFVLDPSKIYFVSIYTIGADKPGDTVAEGAEAAGWGNPYQGNQCTIYSNDINPQRIYMELVEGENASDGTVEIGCGATEVNKTFDMVMKYPKTSGGHDDYEDIHFDYFLGTREEYKTAQTTDGLNDALAAFRAVEGQKGPYATSADLPAAYNTEGNVIKKYMDNGLLLLSASTSFSHTFSTSKAGELEFMAIPIEKELPDGREVCSPIDICFTVKTGGGGPELVIGFDDVDYSDPDLTPAKRGVRMGLEQLTKLQTGGYKLHIPIHAYQDKNKGKSNKLFFSDGWLTVSDTNDPTVEIGKKIARVVPSDAGSTDAYVNNSYMYLTLDFSGCEPTLHEGFYYEVSTMFYDESEKETAEADRCNSDLYMIFKIVPEFVTWESKPVTAPFYNANWNNDGNWQRSEREELYKGDTFGTQNTATAGHPNGYFNNLELNPNLNTHPGYVPMKFTYVTMPTDNHAPDLNGMTYEAVGSEQTGGKLINLANTLNTNTSPVGTHVYNSASTAGIRYDLLVRYGDHADGGEGCFGHRTYNGTTWIDGSTTGLPAKVFDCEKFDGNICREIYFKPGAELLQQQRLRYQKAWVEKELTANKWYLMSSPLKGTYAGDMYVPTTNTEATNGRQLTEAFQPISFSDTPSLWEGTGVGSGSYSRTKYPIYQRSWGLNQAKVYTKVNDIRATDYSAKLNFGTLSTNIVEWSHTYNDVQVPYSTLGGFSIRAHKKDQTTPALIRLPKDDVTYDYYEWNGTDHPAPAAGVGIKSTPKGADVLGQFVYDWNLTNADNVQVGLTLSDVQSQGADSDGNTYYLVGNPFMGSLDMGKFFAQNTAFGNTYYTYEGSVLTAVDVTLAPSETDKHIIKPLQGFFVKCAAGFADRVIFDRRMMTDGNWEIGTAVTPANPAPALTSALTLTTEGSKATIVLNEEAAAGYVANEDVETLFDSNLADVPMVYTVAGVQAVSIDARPELDVVPFGVTCSSDEPVNVNVTVGQRSEVEGQFSILNSQISNLYVYDALTGESVSVGDGSTITVQPNDYGRYFLTSTKASPLTLSQGEGADVLISVRSGMVTVTATNELHQVRALSVSGATVYSDSNCGSSSQFQLQQGTYVIEAETATGRKTVKVLVK